METQMEQTFVNSRGQVLHRWSVSDQKLPKAVCIVVHGLHDHINAYKDMAAQMLKNHDIILQGYDQVGHGLSEGRRADIDQFSHYVEDLIQFVNLIKSEHKSTPIYIMGHNMGGMVLGYALFKDQNLCDGAIMYSPFIDAHPNFVFSLWATRFLSYYLPSFPVGCFQAKNLCRDEVEVNRMTADSLRYQGGIKARMAQILFAAADEFTQTMSQIVTPTLILHGSDDSACLLSGSKRLHDSISSPEKTLKVYPDCYHRLHAEPKGSSEDFVGDLCEWIKRQVKLNQS